MQWLTDYIVCVYHVKQHRKIGTSPLQRWTTGVFGDEHGAGIGMIARPTDQERIRLDFMPFVKRTIRPISVAIDGNHYYDAVLRRFIGASEGSRKRTFIFRRDPRDVSVVYFWDPELQRYSGIPYRNTTHPSISIWELRELRRRLHQIGSSKTDEDAIFEVYARLREREARAATETKWDGGHVHGAAPPTIVASEPSAARATESREPMVPAPALGDIEPYEIEEL